MQPELFNWAIHNRKTTQCHFLLTYKGIRRFFTCARPEDFNSIDTTQIICTKQSSLFVKKLGIIMRRYRFEHNYQFIAQGTTIAQTRRKILGRFVCF